MESGAADSTMEYAIVAFFVLAVAGVASFWLLFFKDPAPQLTTTTGGLKAPVRKAPTPPAPQAVAPQPAQASTLSAAQKKREKKKRNLANRKDREAAKQVAPVPDPQSEPEAAVAAPAPAAAPTEDRTVEEDTTPAADETAEEQPAAAGVDAADVQEAQVDEDDAATTPVPAKDAEVEAGEAPVEQDAEVVAPVEQDDNEGAAEEAVPVEEEAADADADTGADGPEEEEAVEEDVEEEAVADEAVEEEAVAEPEEEAEVEGAAPSTADGTQSTGWVVVDADEAPAAAGEDAQAARASPDATEEEDATAAAPAEEVEEAPVGDPEAESEKAPAGTDDSDSVASLAVVATAAADTAEDEVALAAAAAEEEEAETASSESDRPHPTMWADDGENELGTLRPSSPAAAPAPPQNKPRTNGSQKYVVGNGFAARNGAPRVAVHGAAMERMPEAHQLPSTPPSPPPTRPPLPEAPSDADAQLDTTLVLKKGIRLPLVQRGAMLLVDQSLSREADEAGFERGMLVVSINGTTPDSAWIKKLARQGPDREARVLVHRAPQPPSQPPPPPPPKDAEEPNSDAKNMLSPTVQSPMVLGQQFALPPATLGGMMPSWNVARDSPASTATPPPTMMGQHGTFPAPDMQALRSFASPTSPLTPFGVQSQQIILRQPPSPYEQPAPPMCSLDKTCPHINDEAHQQKFRHTCKIKGCELGNMWWHTRLFMHADQQNGGRGGYGKIDVVNAAAPNQPRAQVTADWDKTKVHFLRKQVRMRFDIAQREQHLRTHDGIDIPPAQDGSVLCKDVGIKPESVIYIHRKGQVPPRAAFPKPPQAPHIPTPQLNTSDAAMFANPPSPYAIQPGFPQVAPQHAGGSAGPRGHKHSRSDSGNHLVHTDSGIARNAQHPGMPATQVPHMQQVMPNGFPGYGNRYPPNYTPTMVNNKGMQSAFVPPPPTARPPTADFASHTSLGDSFHYS